MPISFHSRPQPSVSVDTEINSEGVTSDRGAVGSGVAARITCRTSLRVLHSGTFGSRRWGEGPKNLEINPVNRTRLSQVLQTPRCGARTRAGPPCQCPAIRGRKRCRLHGGLSPGAPKGSRNGNYKNGDWTAEAIEERRWLRDLVQSFGKPGQHYG
jgi:hypothetical protein